jgi:glycerol-3-phosphate dehydrogenase
VRRNIQDLTAEEFDLVIVGGGIFGLCAAWDASLRGLSVALLESQDFAHAATANCFKMIHGGIRYLQHADLYRVRQSTRERSALIRIAPHLARPLPIFLPTYGHGMKGREILATGMKVYDLLTFDRNRGISDPSRRIPPTHSVGREEALERFPDLDRSGLTGGAIFHDGQMYSSARLALSFLLSAAERGAKAANYTEVTRFMLSGDRIVGVAARDTLSGQEFEVRGRVVLNATGGWAHRLLRGAAQPGLEPTPTFSRDAYFIARRPFPGGHALAVTGGTRDPDAIFSRDARHLFVVPWRGHTLVGVWHKVWSKDPSEARVTESELGTWIDEINEAYPAIQLGLDDVALTQCGLVLFGENADGAEDLSYGKRSLLVDHARKDGVHGLVTLVGVRYTTARLEARGAIDLVFRKLGRSSPRCRTEYEPIHGGNFASFERLYSEAAEVLPRELRASVVEALVSNHGSEYRKVLTSVAEGQVLGDTLPDSDTMAAEVIHAVRDEMAVRLGDVVFRRTDLGSAGHPGLASIEAAANLMARELGWTATETQQEVDDTLGEFPALT